MKKLLAVALLSAFATSAFAAEEGKGPYVAVSAGITPSIDFGSSVSAAAGMSYGGYLGYQFNTNFSLEGGYTSLLNGSKLTVSGVDTGLTTSITGTEVAGIISLPLNQAVSPYLRVGSASMSLGSTSNGITTSSTVSGLTYGVGVQFALNAQQLLRVGYSTYSLKDSNTPSTTYNVNNLSGTLVFKF